MQTSTRPSYLSEPPTSLTSPVLHTAAKTRGKIYPVAYDLVEQLNFLTVFDYSLASYMAQCNLENLLVGVQVTPASSL